MMAFYRCIKYGHVVLALFKCFQGIEVNIRLISINEQCLLHFLNLM